MTTMLERAGHAVEDALASEDNHPDDIARAVLMAVREPDDATVTQACDGYYHSADLGVHFTAMIDAILNEREKQ